MEKDKRITRQMIKGIVEMVFNIAEPNVPTYSDFATAINTWMHDGLTPTNESLGYDNKEKDTSESGNV
jgi:hypothetical protein